MIRTFVFAAALGALICLAACEQKKPLPEDNPTATAMPQTQDISETDKSADIVSQGRPDAPAPYPNPVGTTSSASGATGQTPPTLPEDKAGSTKPQPQ